MVTKLKNLVFKKPWLLQGEKDLADRFLQEMFALFRRNGVEATPILLLRVDDVLYSYLLVRRLESTPFVSTPAETLPSAACAQETPETPNTLDTSDISDAESSQKGPKKTKEPKAKNDSDTVQLEILGKARERLRKAMKELEEGCAKAFKPLHQGIADRMKPVLKKAEGILEESLRAEAEEEEPD